MNANYGQIFFISYVFLQLWVVNNMVLYIRCTRESFKLFCFSMAKGVVQFHDPSYKICAMTWFVNSQVQKDFLSRGKHDEALKE